MTAFHFLLSLLIAGYLCRRMVWPLRHRKVCAGVLLALIVPGAFKSVWVRLLGGPHFFAPELPGWVLHCAAWWFGWIYFLLILMLLAEPLRGAWALVSRLKHRPGLSRRQENRLHAAFSLAAAVLASLALYGGMRAPQIRKMELAFSDLPPAADGVRIAVLSDIHAHATVPEARVREFVRLAMAAKPDLILLLGDYADGTVAQVGRHIAPLAGLRARCGVYAIPGNHEYYYDYPAWRNFLTRLGPVMLENDSARVPELGLRIAGVTDPAGRKFNCDPPDLTEALAEAPHQFTILLAHRPECAPEAARLGAKLQLSGHTHGGMLYGLDLLVAKFNAGYVSGLYDVAGMPLVVSNGTGIWNGMPLRLGAPSEIIVLTLRRR